MNGTPGNLKAHLIDLADQDRECLAQIRENMELNSNALAIRIAIRALAKRLSNPQQLVEQSGTLANDTRGKP